MTVPTGVVNLCEMKCYNDKFAVTAEYAMTIRGRINAIREHVSKRSSIQPTLVTTFGLKPGCQYDVPALISDRILRTFVKVRYLQP